VFPRKVTELGTQLTRLTVLYALNRLPFTCHTTRQ